MTAHATSFLVDTFLYTGALIALVLLIRRPVSRHFGPQLAYALWALPLLRFVMPPLVLPAWMAPAMEHAASDAGQPAMIFLFRTVRRVPGRLLPRPILPLHQPICCGRSGSAGPHCSSCCAHMAISRCVES